MGVDLTLIIPFGPNLEMFLGNSEIGLERDSEFFEHIRNSVKGIKQVIPMIYGYHHYNKEFNEYVYGEMTNDCYDQSLTWVKAKCLAHIFNCYKHRSPGINFATGLFLLNLSEDYPIVLYWH